MDRRNFSLLAVTGFLGLAASRPSSASLPKETLIHGKSLIGVFLTTGGGVCLAGSGNFTGGSFATPQDSQSKVGSGSLTFKKNGNGIAKIKSTSIVQEHTNTTPAYIETITSTFDFSYEITKSDQILLFIKASSWKGQFIDGPKNGINYGVELINDDPKKPHFIGHLSVDGKNIEFTTNEKLNTRIKFNDDNNTEIDEVSSCSISGFRR